MQTKKRDNPISEDINLQTDTLIDLPVADEQADETKAGTGHAGGGGGGAGKVSFRDLTFTS